MIDLRKIFLKGLSPRNQGMVSLVAGLLKWDTDIGYHISPKHWIDCIIKNEIALMLLCISSDLSVSFPASRPLIGKSSQFSRSHWSNLPYFQSFNMLHKNVKILFSTIEYSTTPPQSKKLHKSKPATNF